MTGQQWTHGSDVIMQGITPSNQPISFDYSTSTWRKPWTQANQSGVMSRLAVYLWCKYRVPWVEGTETGCIRMNQSKQPAALSGQWPYQHSASPFTRSFLSRVPRILRILNRGISTWSMRKAIDSSLSTACRDGSRVEMDPEFQSPCAVFVFAQSDRGTVETKIPWRTRRFPQIPTACNKRRRMYNDQEKFPKSRAALSALR